MRPIVIMPLYNEEVLPAIIVVIPKCVLQPEKAKVKPPKPDGLVASRKLTLPLR